jgi:transposase
MILGEVGDVRRFPSRHHFASYTAAPIEASSGEVERHRLSRAGNRQLNHALHIVALSNKRNDDRGGAYYATKLAAGKGKKGALRCLKPTPVRHRVPAPRRRPATADAAEPGWAPGGDSSIQRGRLTPQTPTLRSSHTPGSTTTLHPAFQPRLDTEGSHSGALARRLHRHAEPALPSARLGPCARRRL